MSNSAVKEFSVAFLILTVLMLAFSVELYLFARAQDIWIDESTQLSGLTLSPWDIIRWLSGTRADRFGVPGDRMPPISYLLDWSWLRIFGSSVLSLRLFHSAFVICGVLTLAVLSQQRIGKTAAIVTIAFLIFSPKLLRIGVEIRSYPIFFAVTCAQIVVFLKLVPKAGTHYQTVEIKPLAAFAALCLIAIFTHFYGVVSTAAFFIALGCACVRSVRSLVYLVMAGLVILLGSFALIPFIVGAVDMSSTAASTGLTSNRYLPFFFRLFSDSANMVSLSAAAAFIGGTVCLLAAALLAAIVRISNRTPQSIDWLCLVVITGAAAPILANFSLSRFDALKPDYSSWLIAPLALLVGAGATWTTGFPIWDKGGRFVAIVASIGGCFGSTFLFLDRPSMFIHGPQSFVAHAFDELEEPKAILYESDAQWGFAYYPLVFTHKGEIDQYRAIDGGRRLVRLQPKAAGAPKSSAIEVAIASYNHLLLVDSHLRNYLDIRACEKVHVSCPGFPQSKTAVSLIQSGNWKETSVQRRFGLYDAQVIVMDRIGTNKPAANFEQ